MKSEIRTYLVCPAQLLAFALAFLVVIFTPQSSLLAQDSDIITIDSSLVVLNATITNKQGDPVLDLNRDQFEIYEDGQRQSISFFESNETPFAAVILIDTSGSMEQRVSLARSAAINFLYGLRAGDQVAIYNFDSQVSLVRDFSNLRDLTHRAFDLQARGWTVLNDAVYEAASALEKRQEMRKAIVVLSDGADTRSKKSADRALDKALNVNASVYTIDMSDLNVARSSRIQNQGVLKNFAKKTGGRFIKTPGGVEMREAFEAIVAELGIQYTLGYYPINTDKNGKWREIDLKLADKSLKIRTRKGYRAPEN